MIITELIKTFIMFFLHQKFLFREMSLQLFHKCSVKEINYKMTFSFLVGQSWNEKKEDTFHEIIYKFLFQKTC